MVDYGDYPEFIGILTLPPKERIAHLVKLRSKVNAVEKIIKEALGELLIEVDEDEFIDRYDDRIYRKTTTRTTIDQAMFRTMFPDRYLQLYEEGKLFVDKKDIEESPEYDAVLSYTTSESWDIRRPKTS